MVNSMIEFDYILTGNHFITGAKEVVLECPSGPLLSPIAHTAENQEGLSDEKLAHKNS